MTMPIDVVGDLGGGDGASLMNQTRTKGRLTTSYFINLMLTSMAIGFSENGRDGKGEKKPTLLEIPCYNPSPGN